jgi:regulator of protease activity HflC (stomatin/prohibitin superfamily)
MPVEKELRGVSGWVVVTVLLLGLIVIVAGFIQSAAQSSTLLALGCVLLLVGELACLPGFAVVNPNQAMVVTLFGVYKGTLRQSGFWWVFPLNTGRRLSLRIRNFESGKLKVNDRDANPIEIAAVVVWRLVDTFEAAFNVDDYENFMHVQTEAALRNLATSYPYDAHDNEGVSLRLSAGEVAERLRHEIQERLSKAGIEVIEARISHLAYAPEIAGVMLRRQQATAVIAARQKIVEGAVGMVEMALLELGRKNVVQLDEERKAAMVSNLMVVLCSDRGVEPVVNTGTLYQ